MSPELLDVEDVLEIHALQLAEHGGSDGVRAPNLLDSAVARPRAAFGGEFLHEDLFAMAAAYLDHIVGNHPFVSSEYRGLEDEAPATRPRQQRSDTGPDPLLATPV